MYSRFKRKKELDKAFDVLDYMIKHKKEFYLKHLKQEIEFELFYLNREDHLINTITDYPKVLFRLNQESMSIFMTFFRKSKNAEHVRRLLSAEGIVYN